MEELMVEVNWLAVIVGAVAAFLLGWLWYSKTLFADKWMLGAKASANVTWPMLYPMLAQAIGTFLLAWVIGIAYREGLMTYALLIALAIAALIKANGLFASKSKYAITVESGYILAMVVVMMLAHAIF